jgi:putative salt-induced outer membrane protein YdiY
MNFFLKKVIFFLILFFCSFSSYAIELESQREAVVTPRSKRFYTKPYSRQYLAFGGVYSSDYNSKQYELNSRYFYQSDKMVHEMNFDHDVEHRDVGSGTNRRFGVKAQELYDFSLSSKAKVFDGNNYLVGYHRTIYDEYSNFGYDTRTAFGFGRAFFDGGLELDASMSYHDVKHEARQTKTDFITSWRANFKITDNLTFLQRAYWYIDHNSMDNQFRTSLLYRLKRDLSFEIRHNFEQRRYDDEDSARVINRVNRSITIGLVFDLN